MEEAALIPNSFGKLDWRPSTIVPRNSFGVQQFPMQVNYINVSRQYDDKYQYGPEPLHYKGYLAGKINTVRLM